MTDASPLRSITIPRLMRIVSGASAAADELAALATGPDCRFLFVHSGAASATGYGKRLAEESRRIGLPVRECVVSRNDDRSLAQVTKAMRVEPFGYVVGVGGGRVVDVAKLASARGGIDFISVPTQASSDGICSPVAVMVSVDGRPRSVGSRIPAGVIVDMEVLARAPRVTWLSGLGDLVANLSAVRDWRRAADTSGEPIDDFACLTAEAAALSVISDDADLEDRDYQGKLIRGLILSGMAMEMAGSSRPASGSEHLISHALDRTLDEPRAHGLQVALGTMAAFVLRGDDCRRLGGFFGVAGLPLMPDELGIGRETFLAAVRGGRATRPGRATVLDDLDDERLGRLVEAYEREGAGVWR